MEIDAQGVPGTPVATGLDSILRASSKQPGSVVAWTGAHLFFTTSGALCRVAIDDTAAGAPVEVMYQMPGGSESWENTPVVSNVALPAIGNTELHGIFG